MVEIGFLVYRGGILCKIEIEGKKMIFCKTEGVPRWEYSNKADLGPRWFMILKISLS